MAEDCEACDDWLISSLSRPAFGVPASMACVEATAAARSWRDEERRGIEEVDGVCADSSSSRPNEDVEGLWVGIVGVSSSSTSGRSIEEKKFVVKLQLRR